MSEKGVLQYAYETMAAMAEALSRQYGETIRCYLDYVEGQQNEPAFYIRCTNTSQEQKLHNQYNRSQTFAVRYVPERKGTGRSEEISRISNQLYGCLEQITLEGKTVMGIHMRTEEKDGNWEFFVDYNMTLVKQADTEPCMQELEAKGGIKLGAK